VVDWAVNTIREGFGWEAVCYGPDCSELLFVPGEFRELEKKTMTIAANDSARSGITAGFSARRR